MSSEKNTLVRLATLKSPRDLTLGGTSGVTRGGVVRRKFTPNVNAAALAAAKAKNQKADETVVEVKSEKKDNKRDGSNNRRDGKDRRGKNDLYIQKRSIFDTMPATETKPKNDRLGYAYNSSSSSLRPSSSSSSSVRTSLVKVKSENKMDCDGDEDDHYEEDDKEIITRLITHSLLDDDDDDDDDEVELQPLSLPADGVVKKDFEHEIAVKPHVTVIKGEYYLVQLPSILPGNPPMTEEEINNININKNNKNKKIEESVKKESRNLQDFSEGYIGKLRVGKDGKNQLLFGRVAFSCHQGPESNCRQELGMVAAGSRKGPFEHMYRFGRVTRSLVVHLDLHNPSASDLPLQCEEVEKDGTKEVASEEYSVYLCKPEDKALYLFNLPIKCGLEQVATGRLKRVCGRVQLDLQGWPRRDDDDDNVRPLMTSSGCNILPKVFAIGVFSDDQFHITPLSDIVKMRPDFKSFKSRNEDKGMECDEEEEEDDATLVNARMKVKETESAKNKRLASYQHMLNEEKKEAWCELKLLDPTEHYKESSLLSSSTQPCEFNMLWDDYLDVLTNESKPTESKETSLSNLHHLKLNEQVKWVLERCRAIDFQQLTTLLPPSTQHAEVIGYLEQFAILIQGCWVVKSEHIISASNHAGVGLRALRDFVLYKFSFGEGVTRAQLNSLHSLNGAEQAVILDGISRQDKPTRQRVFILDKDEEFIQKNGDMVKRQALLMKQKFEQIKIILPFRPSDASNKQTNKKL